jgi:N-formylglutamate amidohydrolase
MALQDTFTVYGRPLAAGPVVLSVPHAGREYPDLVGLLRYPIERLRPLEDRYADALADKAIADGVGAIVSRLPRLCIDLNRAETDLDPGMVEGRSGAGPKLSTRARGGLGLIPRRLNEIGDVWHAALSQERVRRSIEGHYRPYHATLRAMLAAAKARFGIAILVDIHSMPPLVGVGKPSIVLGDRFGRTVSPLILALAERVFADAGFNVGRNEPYAGGHIIMHHADRARNIQALQIEVDRSLYLDAAFDNTTVGLAPLQRAVGTLVQALTGQSMQQPAIAAE